MDGHVDRWLVTLAPETARAYGRVLATLSKSQNPLRASEAELSSFVREAHTLLMRRRRVSALHSFYRYALDEGLLVRDPSRNLYLRALTIRSNRELSHTLGLSLNLTWGALLAAAQGGPTARWRTKAGAELLRRALAAIRACRDERDLVDVLARPLTSPGGRRRRESG